MGPSFESVYNTVPSGRYYNFKRGNAEFFVLDSNYMDPDHLARIEKTLTESNALWKICYFHHPLYSDGPAEASGTDLRFPRGTWCWLVTSTVTNESSRGTEFTISFWAVRLPQPPSSGEMAKGFAGSDSPDPRESELRRIQERQEIRGRNAAWRRPARMLPKRPCRSWHGAPGNLSCPQTASSLS
jgi:hypothetical protein